MKFFYSILFLSVCCYISSCKKGEVANLNLDVSVDKASYSVGDTVTFRIIGNPEQLLFYSGEPGHKYSFRDRTKAETDSITLEFATNRRYGSDAQQPQSLRLLVSQRFNGNYSAGDINETTDWADITNAFTLSTPQSSDAAYVPSGLVNLAKLSALGFDLDKSKPVYFAFRYKGVTGFTQPRWWINKFEINTTASDGQVFNVTSIEGSGWTQVKVLPESPVSWVFGTDNVLKFQGGGAKIDNNTVWTITRALDMTLVQPDTGVPIKDGRERMTEFKYVYTKPGTYKVAFIGANINIYGESRDMKELSVIVNP